MFTNKRSMLDKNKAMFSIPYTLPSFLAPPSIPYTLLKYDTIKIKKETSHDNHSNR
ncbi:hypothetical protein GCM10027286_28210 [Virgibacillus ainsalahensis]